MKSVNVRMTRIYLTEASGQAEAIMRYLRETAQIRGVSLFRAISGFGAHHQHSAQLLDLSLDLPLVIEFFDSPDKVQAALSHLSTLIKSEHIVCWDAQTLQAE